MKILTEADSIIKKILGEQEYDEDVSYRLLSWCAFIKYETGQLLHNYMTGQTLLLGETEDYTGDENKKALVRNWFMVHEENDDIKFLEELRGAMKLFDNKKNISSYKILTTTDCNARCFYCYELGIKKEDMSESTALKVADYIRRSCGDSEVTLAWFGGEPMVNTSVIDIICGELGKNGIKYVSVMTSNGYLFDESIVEKAVDKWHLKNIQITLDGTRDIYNKIKSYAEDDDDPYEKVVGNIRLLADAGVKVNIRLNMSLKNSCDMYNLIDELSKRFADTENVSAYVSGLFQELEDQDPSLKKELFGKLIIAGEKISKTGLDRPKLKNMHTRVGGCMADNDSHRGISPGGDLMKCEHFIYERLVGSVTDGDDRQAIAGWKEKMPDGELCGTCAVRPLCYRLANCPVSHPCDEFEQREFVLRKESQILKNAEIINRQGAKTTDFTEVSGDEIC